jgi:proteic killer suppression protein
MRIRSFAHAGLKRLYFADQRKGLPPEVIDKLRKMLAFLQDMETVDELRSLPAWGTHRSRTTNSSR